MSPIGNLHSTVPRIAVRGASHYTPTSHLATGNSHASLLSTSISPLLPPFKLALPSMSLAEDTPGEVVRLPIDDNWWHWRGFWQFSRDEGRFFRSPELLRVYGYPWMSRDIMDADDFKEEHAFPLLKPSIDVLGVPRRSRRQRGWYQVRSPSRPAVLLHAVAWRPMYSAADLPPELIASITEALADRGTRHELASCARVCRHWATVLQHLLFSHISLRSRPEIDELIRIYRDSITKLPLLTSGRFTQVTLEANLYDPPFTHHVPRLKYTSWISLKLNGPLPTFGGGSLRSIHGALPRTPPRTSFCQMRSLFLCDVNFRSFMDLLELVCELPRLVDFDGTRLTWGEHGELRWPNVPRRHPRRIGRMSAVEVVLRDCMPGRRWLAIVLSSRQSTPDEFTALVRQLEEQLVSLEGFAAIASGVHWVEHGGGSGLGLLVDYDIAVTPWLVGHIVLVVRHGTRSWIAAVDWLAFCRTLASFSRLDYIEIAIEKPGGSEDVKESFMQHAYEHLETLSRECEIKLKLRTATSDDWHGSNAAFPSPFQRQSSHGAVPSEQNPFCAHLSTSSDLKVAPDDGRSL